MGAIRPDSGNGILSGRIHTRRIVSFIFLINMKTITVESVAGNTSREVWQGSSIVAAMRIARPLNHAIIRRGDDLFEYRTGELVMWNAPLLP